MGSASLPCPGKQQPEQGIGCRKAEQPAKQAGQPVDGLFSQCDGIKVKLPLTIGQGGRQILQCSATADPQTGGLRAVAIVQPQRVKGNGSRYHFAGKIQRAGRVEQIEGGGIRSLAGKIGDGDFIRSGAQRLPLTGKSDGLLTAEVDLVPDLQAVRILGSNIGKAVLEQIRCQSQLIRCAEQSGNQGTEHSQFGCQQDSEQLIAL